MQDNNYVDICNAGVSLEDVHNLNNMEVKRTLYLAQKIDSDISRESVKKGFTMCQCIEPVPITY